MKNLLLIFIGIIVILSSCVTGNNGDLDGVLDREVWFTPDPHGMIFVPPGSYNMGQNDQDISWAMTTQPKTVTVQAFWMDETEITNNEYRQFVYWVRDSIARKMLGVDFEEDFLLVENEYEEPIEPPLLNWWTEILWDDPDQREILKPMFYEKQDRFYRHKEFDVRKFNYEYWWIDFKQAAQKKSFINDNGDVENRRRWDFDKGEYTQQEDGQIRNEEGIMVDVENRGSFIMHDIINVYPDTLAWVGDFTYSYNEPMTKMYFWHPAYDYYPVVGVNWLQATAFNIWRTQLKNENLAQSGETYVQNYRLPTESEWEYAARGGLDLSMYPWGGYYTRNYKGCFITNFKPLRGNYSDDGGIQTLIVGSYEPNEFGLYDMAGNVAEWTSNAFDESAYSYTHDLNPDYQYWAKPNDPPARKRKVIRGGSWKDVAMYLQNGVRTYEYQDTAKSYIGFRSVRMFLGRSREDGGDASNVY